MKSHFTVALLPDLIVLLVVAGAALHAASARPTREIFWILQRVISARSRVSS
jgi:hypothetical protein